ncbi:stachyose synthase [Magnolia sinica]|uniref:stachyose synthase n=1 Tax=Magnolia sinica TaxID=86752 RepID=UPI0026586090|nr:stachyose synthase [Magnolia sinica]
MAPPNEVSASVLDQANTNNINRFFELSGGNLSVNGVTLLSDVPDNVSFSGFSSICQTSDAPLPLFHQVQSQSFKGGFLGFSKQEPSDHLMNSLGKFIDRNFVSVFRFKTWWSTMWVGSNGSDLQKETQWALLNVPELRSYVLILPSIEGSFRSALQPGPDGHVMIYAESGSTKVKSSSFDAIVYVHISENPYNLMKEAYSALRVHLNTFRLLEEKSVPSLIDKFGWCTWDAFYLAVDPVGVWHGVKDFINGGIAPRFLIIDDGWQSINLDGDNPNEDAKNLILGGQQMTARLYRFQECDKFGRYKAGTMLGPNAPSFDSNRRKLLMSLISKAIEIENAEKGRDRTIKAGVTELSGFDSKIENLKVQFNEMFGNWQGSSSVLSGGNQSCSSCCCKTSEDVGLKAFTEDLRKEFKGLDDIYVWHALCGAWGGVRPGATHLNSKAIPVTLSPSLDGTMSDLAVVKIVEGGVGLVHPDQAADFYDSMHSYLAKVGITGVKVDVIHTLEYVSEEYGGRVELAKAYYKGLTESLVKNFKGTGLIASMQQCNDFFFLGTQQISFGRVGDDFWFQDPNGDPMGVYWLQGVHMIHCAFNSMWMGQIIQPDWDMFQSDHLCAKFHAGSRAICGGPVYVSDSVGGHDFDLLKKLVFPDGTIPKCQHFALPTRDCLFKNPLFDGESILKIWNVNKFGGVLGAFNCQGAGWDPKEQRIKGYSECYKPVSGTVHVTDIEWDQKQEAAQMGHAEEYALYLNQAEELLLTNPTSDPILVTIRPSTFEIFTFVPIKKIGPHVKFAPIGLTNMFNGGGTIQAVDYSSDDGDDVNVKIKVKGGGKFLSYSNGPPKKIYLNGAEVGFELLGGGKLILDVPWIEECGLSEVGFAF